MGNNKIGIWFSFFSGICLSVIFLYVFLPETTHVATLPDGSVYDGDIVDNKFNGKGTLRKKNGTVYEGEFKNGLFSGKGKLTNPYSRNYEGEFRKGIPDGQGELTFKNNFRYVGEVLNYTMHGKGIYYAGEMTYDGTFHKDMFVSGIRKTGEGEEVYKGEFKKWLLNGEGEYISPEGDRYIGQFKNGYLSGEGELFKKNGDHYKGEFRYGRIDGQGTMTYANIEGEGKVVSGEWDYGELLSDTIEEDKNEALLVERHLYDQNKRLESLFRNIKYTDSNRINMYFLGVAGDGFQNVFVKEVGYAKALFDSRLGTSGRSLILANTNKHELTHPMSTRISLQKSLKALSTKMDSENDILFLYLTSHGSNTGDFKLSQPGINLPDLNRSDLSKILDQVSIKWKVIVVSACYSGMFLEELKNDTTLIITASDEDRKSFGCANDRDFTYFGEAFLKSSLNKTRDFVSAFEMALEEVHQKETEEDKTPSKPQISAPETIQSHLNKWREQGIY